MKIHYLFALIASLFIAYLTGFNSGLAEGTRVTLEYDYRCKQK